MADISAATFIRDNIVGAFCLFESMASLLPLVDDMTILDVGSTDGTLEILDAISAANPKVRVKRTHFSKVDAGAFADIANECVASWDHEHGIFWQADEIWHEHLLKMTEQELAKGNFDMTFWRYQLKENFQLMKWPPHLVHRVGTKGNFTFVDDGMNTARHFEPQVCSTYNAGWFIRWGDEFKSDYTILPTHEMILDVSAIGGFLDNIRKKRELHAPMWHENPNVEGSALEPWYRREVNNVNWVAPSIPFNIPRIMHYHVGRKTYTVRPGLIEALKSGNTREFTGL